MIRPMTASAARSVVGSEYTLGEEIANSITSGIASALSVAALVVMVVHAALRGDGWHVTGCAIFGASLIVSNLSSTLYHAIAPPRAKRVFRVFDHLSIYLLIAGTYMPFVLVSLVLDGGLCYTAGVIFYAWKRLPFGHAIWHLFVLAGNAFHVFAVLYYAIPPQP